MNEEMAMQYQRGYIDGFKDGKAKFEPKNRILDMADIYKCSKCQEDIHVKIRNIPRYKFCPICGIRMVEQEGANKYV